MCGTPIRTYTITGEKFLHRFARKSDGSEIAYPVCNYRDTLSAEAAGEDWIENGGSIESLSREDLLSEADAAHERRMLKRQLRRAGIEWNQDQTHDHPHPNTADALRDQIRALGLEPMEVCFHRSIECPACVLPAGHSEPHEPATVKVAKPELIFEQQQQTKSPVLSLTSDGLIWLQWFAS